MLGYRNWLREQWAIRNGFKKEPDGYDGILCIKNSPDHSRPIPKTTSSIISQLTDEELFGTPKNDK